MKVTHGETPISKASDVKMLVRIESYVLSSRCIVGASETQLSSTSEIETRISRSLRKYAKNTNIMPSAVSMERMKQGVVQTCMERVVGLGVVLMVVVVRVDVSVSVCNCASLLFNFVVSVHV